MSLLKRKTVMMLAERSCLGARCSAPRQYERNLGYIYNFFIHLNLLVFDKRIIRIATTIEKSRVTINKRQVFSNPSFRELSILDAIAFIPMWV